MVYPHHGAATIVRREARPLPTEPDTTVEYFVLRLAYGDLTLMVPVDNVDEVGLREVIAADEVEDVFALMRRKDARMPTNWSRRFKNHQEKLKSGDIYQVAEVVRNLAARNRDSSLSAAERTMYDRARINLVSEIAPALKVSAEEAERYLDDALAKGVLKPAKEPAKKKA